MVLCEIDNNIILSEPLRSRASEKMVKAFKVITARLCAAGMKPKKYVIGNKASVEFKQVIKEAEMDYELAPKGQHRQNIAKKAIQT